MGTSVVVQDMRDEVYSPGIDTKYKSPTAFSVSSERHRQYGVNEIVQISKLQCP